jgi:drug/metabolite transporter (DMT)-like permease
LKATKAATVQLSVPVIAAMGGIAFLGESVTLRLIVASTAILGGIALVILEGKKPNGPLQVVPADATGAAEPDR